MLLPRYLMKGLINLDKSFTKYSIAPDDLVRGQRSRLQKKAVEIAQAST